LHCPLSAASLARHLVRLWPDLHAPYCALLQLRTTYQPGGLYIGPGLEDMLTIVDAAGVPLQNVIMPWGITQRYSVYGQLMMGIRQGCPASMQSTRASPDTCRHHSLAPRAGDF
jgi:hypothetical protein